MTHQWIITKTVSSHRRNLFDLTPRQEHQIATLVSGSMSEIARFERNLALIELAPAMRGCLHDTLELLDEFGFVQNSRARALRDRVRLLLEKADLQSK